MMRAEWCRYRLAFRFEARTSRETMWWKDTYFVRIFDEQEPQKTLGMGECALFRGLSADDVPDYEAVLADACADPLAAIESPYSSIRFGFETALCERKSTPWIRGEAGIPINGLIWMGDKATMAQRIREKLDAGFKVLKLKIGGINFDDELDLLRAIRKEFSVDVLEIRLDANGSFSPDDALSRIERLSRYGVHSIEQPIHVGYPEAMARICRQSPVAIALDEELIAYRNAAEAEALVTEIHPQYLILKPALCGGFAAADNYIAIAERLGIGWWATSALESNIGLDAIARWLAEKEINMPQGLGTGQLYDNNIASPLELRGSALWRDPATSWGDISTLPWQR